MTGGDKNKKNMNQSILPWCSGTIIPVYKVILFTSALIFALQHGVPSFGLQPSAADENP